MGRQRIGSSVFVAGVCCACIAGPAWGQCDNWSGLGSGANGPVYAMTEYGNELVVGGFFTPQGSQPGSYIARWNGSTWQTMGSGMDWIVNVVMEFDGDLIAGGGFDTAGGVTVNHIARWNGSSWSAIGSGMNNDVRALAVYNGELIAGGTFQTAGGNSANFIARWTGSSWQPLGSGLSGPANALAVFNGDLIVGGGFFTAGGVLANGIARWNGATWQAMGAGFDASVNALAVHDGELIAGGEFMMSGGSDVAHLARWTGSAWAEFGGGADDHVYALLAHDDELFACGEMLIAGNRVVNGMGRWDGLQWQEMHIDLAETEIVLTAAAYVGRVYAGGLFQEAGAAHASNVASWQRDGLIAQGPADVVVTEGGPAVFTVQLGGLVRGGFYSLQWRKGGVSLSNGGHVSGVTTLNLTVSPASAADIGAYDVVVTTFCDSVISRPAALCVIENTSCPEDITNDFQVNLFDLLDLLDAWGACK